MNLAEEMKKVANIYNHEKAQRIQDELDKKNKEEYDRITKLAQPIYEKTVQSIKSAARLGSYKIQVMEVPKEECKCSQNQNPNYAVTGVSLRIMEALKNKGFDVQVREEKETWQSGDEWENRIYYVMEASW